MKYRFVKNSGVNSGFTLIELAMVLLILALLLSSFLAPLATKIEQEERNNTQTQLEEIKEVLLGFVLQNNALPCPDCSDNTGGCAAATANDGQADVTGGLCDTTVGNLPWVDLGVKGTDEWDTIFIYGVDSEYADATDGTPAQAGCTGISTTLNVSFSLCSDGDITVLDSNGGSTVASNLPAIVVSQGKNAVTSTSADEAENTDGDGTFVDKDYSQAAGSEFDDLLIWVSPHVLRTTAVKSGLLP